MRYLSNACIAAYMVCFSAYARAMQPCEDTPEELAALQEATWPVQLSPLEIWQEYPYGRTVRVGLGVAPQNQGMCGGTLVSGWYARSVTKRQVQMGGVDFLTQAGFGDTIRLGAARVSAEDRQSLNVRATVGFFLFHISLGVDFKVRGEGAFLKPVMGMGFGIPMTMITR